MRSALVLGGTRFIGRHLVMKLVADGVHVTVATRGRTPDAFGDSVVRATLDRANAASIRAALGERTWDVCFDQVCLSGDDALATCEALAGRVGRYVQTSSGVVYPFGPELHAELDFDPHTHPTRPGDSRSLGYEEGKRQAERALFSSWTGPLVAVRLPMILGVDDLTRKLRCLLDHAREGTPVPVVSSGFVTNYLAVDEAVRFLVWAATSATVGAINACSDDALSLADLGRLLDDVAGTHTTFDEGSIREGLVSLALPGSLRMDNTRARREGFDFAPIAVWLPELVRAHL